MKAIRARAPLPSTEAPACQSRIVAPAGLFPTDEDRAPLAEATAGDGGAVRSGRFTRERETSRRTRSP